MRMPFGKYRGWDLRDIPESYLVWLLDKADISPTLRESVELALGITQLRHEYAALLAAVARAESEHATAPRGLPERWLRTMARRYHPDRGGDTRTMQAVNEGYALLRELLADVPAVEEVRR